jgi:hypothetical protein
LAQSTSDRDLYRRCGRLWRSQFYITKGQADGEAYVDGGIADPLPALRHFSVARHVSISSVAKGTLAPRRGRGKDLALQDFVGSSPSDAYSESAGRCYDTFAGPRILLRTRRYRISPSNPSLEFLGQRPTRTSLRPEGPGIR